MILKYKVGDSVDKLIGVRFKPDGAGPWGDGELSGLGKFVGFMEAIIEQTFNKVAGTPYWFQKNKCRYSIRIRESEFKEGIKQLETVDLLIVEQVASLGRLVR